MNMKNLIKTYQKIMNKKLFIGGKIK